MLRIRSFAAHSLCAATYANLFSGTSLEDADWFNAIRLTIDQLAEVKRARYLSSRVCLLVFPASISTGSTTGRERVQNELRSAWEPYLSRGDWQR